MNQAVRFGHFTTDGSTLSWEGASTPRSSLSLAADVESRNKGNL